MEICDYCFGSHTSIDIWELKIANEHNLEFLQKCEDWKKEGRKNITLFIDNLRLYKRQKNISSIFTNMEEFPNNNFEEHKSKKLELYNNFFNQDLLKLCQELDYLNFIIFTGLDDTNIDEEIFERIPKNVLKIYVSSANIHINEIVRPFPFGLPRKVSQNDNRLNIIEEYINKVESPQNLLYINHSIGSNIFRNQVNNYFKQFDWCDIQTPKSIGDDDYKNYLEEIKKSFYVLSVDGNAKNCDCYRVWETIYMKRVPVLIKNKNFEELFQNIPVLLVDSYNTITKEFLESNIHIFEKINNFDLNKLDIKKIYNKILSEFEYLEIIEWIKNYATNINMSLVIGISGGVDSAVTSTLCALTGLKTYVVSLPINRNEEQLSLARKHISWLKENYKNVESLEIDLTSVYKTFLDDVNINNNFTKSLSLANTKSRLRMVTLYHIASNLNSIVVGTGNKIEDFGIGFFTKYGDGGVDISPIADLTKTEVIEIAKKLEINKNIIYTSPTDGLWEDNRTDEEQIGTTYSKLEWAMNFHGDETNLSFDEKNTLEIFRDLNKKNKHKMIPIPMYQKKIID